MKRFRVACDIGGTFTDIVVFDQQERELRLAKVPSDPGQPQQPVLDGTADMGIDMNEVEFFGHGSTIALNTLIQRKGSKVGLITTKGFRDILEIQRFNRPDMYNLFYKKPEPLVPRYLRLEVDERILYDGTVRTELDLAEVDARVDQLLAEGAEAIGVVFINAYRNPRHEEECVRHIRSRHPELQVVASTELSREWREFERSSTTVLTAYLVGSVHRYLTGLTGELSERGFDGDVLVTRSDGGLMTADTARQKPVSLLMSGPAGGVLGAQFYSALTSNPNVITLDMGGTSTDVCLVENGVPVYVREQIIEGYPVQEPFIDIYSIGAGGGTVAWVDRAGMLKVGPHSAGARPGPACYGRGGTDPTVTDANLLLGRIDPNAFLGGQMFLDAAASRDAFNRLARVLAMDVDECVAGAVRIVNAAMVNAIRAVSVERGYDPRDFNLLVFGGAGPLHGAALAAELGIPRCVVPKNPSHLSAWGILVADLKHSFSRTEIMTLADLDFERTGRILDDLMTQARNRLTADRTAEDNMEFKVSLDCRYAGQEHSVNVPCGSGLDPSELDAIRTTFDQLHHQLYSFSMPDTPCEVVAVRVDALGRIQPPEMVKLEQGGSDPAPAARGRRPVYFEQAGGFTDCAVYDRERLLAGNRISGPAIIEEPSSNTVVHPGQLVTVDDYGNLIIETKPDG